MCTETRKPHMHAAIIKEWADGATIQARPKGTEENWNVLSKPFWLADHEYRVKPELKTPGQVAFDGSGFYSHTAWSSQHSNTQSAWEKGAKAVIDAYKEGKLLP